VLCAVNTESVVRCIFNVKCILSLSGGVCVVGSAVCERRSACV